MSKPIPEHVFLRHLRLLGWTLKKGSIDYVLYNGDQLLCSIKIIHAKGKKREASPTSIRKVEKLCEERGLKWPPTKK